jgi:hypothetical protein
MAQTTRHDSQPLAGPQHPTMDAGRRRFIRLAGGGVLAAATAGGLGGCSDAFPPEALEAWSGPAGGCRAAPLGGGACDPGAELPQPAALAGRPARARHHPAAGGPRATAADDRPLVPPDPGEPGHLPGGAGDGAGERGQQARVEMFPQGAFAPRAVDARPVARITWVPGRSPATPSDPAVPVPAAPAHCARWTTTPAGRCCHRPCKRCRAAWWIRACASAATHGPGTARGAAHSCAGSPHAWSCCTPRTVMESAQLTRVGPEEIARHRDGISINSPMLRLASAVGGLTTAASRRPRAAPPSGQMMARFERPQPHGDGLRLVVHPTARHAAAGMTRHAPRCRPAGPTCACSCVPRHWACRCTR